MTPGYSGLKPDKDLDAITYGDTCSCCVLLYEWIWSDVIICKERAILSEWFRYKICYQVAYPMGLLYSQYETQIKEYLKGRYWIAIPIIIGLLIVKFLSGDYTLVCAELPDILLGPLVAVLMYKLPLPTENKILNFLGTLSFEIYLTHGAFEQLLKNAFASPYLYIVVVVASTILTSWLLHNVYSRITSPLLAKVK